MIHLKLVTLFSAGLFLIIAPTLHLQGVETDNPQKVTVVVQNDDEITKEIKKQINEDKDFAQDAAKVEIKTEKGKVTLNGTVPDQETKDDIEVVAKDVAGENNVVNNIVVEVVKT